MRRLNDEVGKRTLRHTLVGLAVAIISEISVFTEVNQSDLFGRAPESEHIARSVAGVYPESLNDCRFIESLYDAPCKPFGCGAESNGLKLEPIIA